MSPAARAPGLHTFPCESLSTKKLDWEDPLTPPWGGQRLPGGISPQTRAAGTSRKHQSWWASQFPRLTGGEGQGPSPPTHPEAGLGSAGRRPGPESLGAT